MSLRGNLSKKNPKHQKFLWKTLKNPSKNFSVLSYRNIVVNPSLQTGARVHVWAHPDPKPSSPPKSVVVLWSWGQISFPWFSVTRRVGERTWERRWRQRQHRESSWFNKNSAHAAHFLIQFLCLHCEVKLETLPDSTTATSMKTSRRNRLRILSNQ